MPSDDRRIAAVVVTFNRLELLQRLVERLRRGAGSGRGAGRRQRLDRRHGGVAGRPSSRRAGVARPHPGRQHRRRRRLPRRACAWAVERGADLVWLMDDDGTAGARLPRRCCSRTPASSTSGARSSSTRPTPSGWSSRSGCPGGTRVVHAMADVRRAADGRPDPRHRDPVQRRAGHPRAGRADRPAPRGVLHLGRRPRVPPARRARRRPHRHRRRRPRPAPVGRRPRARR